MVLFKGPFTDTEGQNSVLIPRGAYAWLKIALKQGSAVVAPDADAFERNDIFAIYDPDDNPITRGVATADPDDPQDTYTSASATYVGLDARRTVADGVTTSGSAVVTSATAAFNANDVGKRITGTGIPADTTITTVTSATQVTLSANATATATGVSLTIGVENVGLYHDGAGHVALKVFIPVTDEDTSLDPARQYTVTWKLKKAGLPVTNSETFDVGPAGVIVFNSGIVTVEEVTDGLSTSLDDDTIQRLILRAEARVRGRLIDCGVDPDAFTELPGLVREAIIFYAQGLIFNRDAGAGLGPVVMRKEGSKQVRYSASTEKMYAGFMADSKLATDEYCDLFGTKNKVKFITWRQARDTALWDPNAAELP